jgi:hypothetical protein
VHGASGYIFVYTVEIVLLLATLMAMEPLLRARTQRAVAA